jgi:hypothetical protein
MSVNLVDHEAREEYIDFVVAKMQEALPALLPASYHTQI